MNKHQAMETLLRYRPGTGDEQDPHVREALRLAGQDPDLAVWLENHKQFQQVLSTAMRDVPVESGLKEQILSERHARLSFQRIPRRTMVSASVAALLGLVVVGIVAWFANSNPEAEFNTFRSRMVRAAARGYSMDLESHSKAEVRTYLRNHSAHGDWQSPANLENELLLGCAVIKWRNQPAALICYGAQREPDLWLFVVDASAVPKGPEEAIPVFDLINRMGTLSWSRGGKTYLLMGYRTEDELRKLAGAEG